MMRILAVIALCSALTDLHAQAQDQRRSAAVHPFVAYELGEAVFNRFQSYSGEVGLRFSNQHLLRLTHMNVQLSERHLASSFAGAVDGPGVSGSFFGFEAFYDIPVLWRSLHLGPSVGYYRHSYAHTILGTAIKNRTMTFGAALTLREKDLFGVEGLYYALSLPFRISLNPIAETTMGEAVISDSTFDNNIWLFVGYEF